MEAGQRISRWTLPLIVGIVLLLRLPFLTQAIQGDDPYYLYGARHALIDPLHPTHARYAFQGDIVDMRGHPHPPLNSWFLAGLLLVFGGVSEVGFRAAYVSFSVIAAVGMWSMARRWSPQPLLATLLFLATPAFLVSGSTWETDLPFLAFWMAGFALFTGSRFGWAAAALFLAAMTSYQCIVATPILWVWCWFHARRSKAAWAVACAPVVTVLGYQAFERITGGALPASVLAGYFSTYGLQQFANKLRNAAALTVHTGWLVFPVAAAVAFRQRWMVGVIAAAAGIFIDPHPLFWLSFGIGAMVIAGCIRRRTEFLTAWVLIFFASALALFFAGAARYLLPMSAAVVVLVSQRLSRNWLSAAVALNFAVSLLLAVSSFQYWNGYRDIARSLPPQETGQLWINGEWGLRYYLEERGGKPLTLDDIIAPGDRVVSTELGFPIPVKAPLEATGEYDITPSVPLRLMGLGSKSGYATIAFGLRPFDVSTAPADRVRVQVAAPRQVTLEWLPMSSPASEAQIAGGVYALEGETRWMAGSAVLLLKQPDRPRPIEVQVFLPETAPAKEISVVLDGTPLLKQQLPGPGLHVVRTAPASGQRLTITLDKTFSPGQDRRKLGAVLVGAGFKD